MAWYEDYLKEKESRNYGVSDKLVGEEPDYSSLMIQKNMQTPDESQSYQSPSTAQTGGNTAQAAMAGGAAGGPAGAAVAAGGSLATQYLAEKAAAERARRDRAAAIEQQYAQNQNQGFQTIMNAIQGALR